VLVADRDVDELRREVEVALAVVVPEVAALAAGDGIGSSAFCTDQECRT
jgi:hypothetical protein